jgi:hypothetical protein
MSLVMRLANRSSRIVIAIALASAMIGCAGSSSNIANTHVSKEELYKTGNFDYDEFFEDVNGLQGSAKSMVGDEKAARAPLGQTLGVGETSIDRMLEVLKDKADEFAQSKNRVKFEIAGIDEEGKPLAGKPIEVTPSAAKGRPLSKDAEDFASGLEQMIQKEGQVWEKYAPLTERSKRLAEKAGTLRGSLEKDFPALEGNKREDIAGELKAAKVVTEQIAELSDKVVANALRIVKKSGELLVAAANAEIKAPEKSAKWSKAGKSTVPIAKIKPSPSVPPPGSAAKKPSPPAASGGDFNP